MLPDTFYAPIHQDKYIDATLKMCRILTTHLGNKDVAMANFNVSGRLELSRMRGEAKDMPNDLLSNLTNALRSLDIIDDVIEATITMVNKAYLTWKPVEGYREP